MNNKNTYAWVFLLIAFIFNNPVYAHNLTVTTKDGKCIATIGGEKLECVLGRNGISRDKHEGDGTTPAGEFPLREIFIRIDRIDEASFPKTTGLKINKLTPEDGWCDDPNDINYNKYVNLSHFDPQISHEDLYRNDHLYDIFIVVGYNDDPVIAGKGSAIFIHVASPTYSPTAGCVAFAESDLLKILKKLTKDSRLIVLSPK